MSGDRRPGASPRPRAWVLALCVAAGAGAASFMVLTIGAIEARRRASEVGAVLDWSNSIANLTNPYVNAAAHGYLLAIGLVTVSTVGLASRRLQGATRTALVLSFTVSAIALVAWGFSWYEPSFYRDFEEIFGTGWRRWVELGGTSPLTHLVAVTPIAVWIADRWGRNSLRRGESGDSGPRSPN